MKNVLLISGGLDSMVINSRMGEFVDEFIYVKYRGDHPATLQELKCIRDAGIEPTILNIENLTCDKKGFYSGRNMKIIVAVRERFIGEDINVIVGNTANDNFTDNMRTFFYKLEEVINSSYEGTIRITCPLENMSKKQLVKEAMDKNISFYFCDKGEESPCKKCHSCKAMKDAGYFNR